jgi:FMN phosphatase YigB (HAD superfamily)
LIIFDLDDTLIDTSGVITPFQLKNVLRILVETHQISGDFEQNYKELLAINQMMKSSQDSLAHFIESKGGNMASCGLAIETLRAPLPDHLHIPTTPNAKEILTFLKKFSILACVTIGHPVFQEQKLKKAGLDTGLFSRIAVSENRGKRPYYQELAGQFAASPKEVWVCGDRVDADLVPAHELGFHTIHMRWGRGLLEKGRDWIEHSISSLKELQGIIQ